jgi:archaellum biogenesis ATPase FlaH
MNQNLQTVILKHLKQDESFTRKVLPHLKKSYFEGSERIVFSLFLDYITKYNKIPNGTSLNIIFSDSDYINHQNASEVSDIISSLDSHDDSDHEWLIEETEKWCKERAIYLALMESIEIVDGKKPDVSENAIPSILEDALAVSFDTNIGHDYIDDAKERFSFYHSNEERIPFDLEMFNKITKGGVPNKTLNIILGGTNVGKSLCMCHFASMYLSMGYDVLYVTLEMAEERIAERIDANLFDVELNDLEGLSEEVFMNKLNSVKKKTHGKLIIKEYPTGAAHVGHMRSLLSELKLKKGFTPKVVFVDYLNIMASSRVRGLGGNVNTYSLVKSIAEELRGFGMENNLPVWSATQVNRQGFNDSDLDLTNTSESFGLPQTADFMVAVISNETLDSLNQYLVKQLKSRYNNKGIDNKFVIGVDKAKQRLYDVDNSTAGVCVTSTNDNPAPIPNIQSNQNTGRGGGYEDFKF